MSDKITEFNPDKPRTTRSRVWTADQDPGKIIQDDFSERRDAQLGEEADRRTMHDLVAERFSLQKPDEQRIREIEDQSRILERKGSPRRPLQPHSQDTGKVIKLPERPSQ